VARDDREALLLSTYPEVRNIQGTFREHSGLLALWSVQK